MPSLFDPNTVSPVISYCDLEDGIRNETLAVCVTSGFLTLSIHELLFAPPHTRYYSPVLYIQYTSAHLSSFDTMQAKNGTVRNTFLPCDDDSKQPRKWKPF